MSEKSSGYILLGIGLLVMVVSVVTVILLFTGNLEPIKLFNIPAPSLDPASFMPTIPGLPSGNGGKIELIPTDSFNKITNLSVQFLLMTFIMSFGFKLADLGVKLLRPIKIEAKQ